MTFDVETERGRQERIRRGAVRKVRQPIRSESSPARASGREIQVFRLIDILPDTLLVYPLTVDPDNLPDPTPDKVTVAKMFLLRNSIVHRLGVSYTYYPSTTKRMATIDANGISQIEVVLPDYVVHVTAVPNDPNTPIDETVVGVSGDLIVAGKFSALDVDPDQNGIGMTDVNGDPVVWMELPNGRQWFRKRIQNA